MEYSRCQNYRAIWSAILQHLKHSIGFIFLPHGALSDLLQKSAHHYKPHPMEYSISTYFCAIWSTPECLDLYARWSSKMIKKSNSIRPKTFAKWSTPECQDLFARRSSQILIKQLHLFTYMCQLECSTLLLNIVLQMAYFFYTCGVLQIANFFNTCGLLQVSNIFLYI